MFTDARIMTMSSERNCATIDIAAAAAAENVSRVFEEFVWHVEIDAR